MWLDRFSNQSTPAGSPVPNRPYSPAPPRKSSYLAPPQRNGINPAAARSTSSLIASPASSDLSLPIPTRTNNFSSLRYEQKPSLEVAEPSVVLEGILDSRRTSHTKLKSDGGPANVKLRDKIDFEGLGLQDYANRALSGHHVADILGQSEHNAHSSRHKYTEFHENVIECDRVLGSVDLYLTNFKADLGQVSAEIESLQARSIRLNAQLDNRRQVEKLLGPAVETLSISPGTIRSIAEGSIDDGFVRALTEIEARSISIALKHKDNEPHRALDDIIPLLEELKARAIERIRDYMVAQIKALRSPNINAQIIQQQTLSRHKELFPFLARNHNVLAEEIAVAYANTVRWYFSSNFMRYRTALDKLQLFPFDLNDLLGSDPAVKRGILTGSKGNQSQYDPFSLGRRADILRAKSDTALPAHLAEDSKATHHLEIKFYNFNQALLDNVSAEYSIVTEVFSTYSYQQVSKRVNEIFEPTFLTGHETTKSLVDSTTDCLGILLCVRLNQHFAFETQKRKVPALDSYINYTNILLWPRFQKIMDLHCESLKKVPTTSSRGAAAAFSLVGGTDTSKASMAPHMVTQRFGQFLHGILSLSAEAGDDEPVANSLARLRSEYETLMGKLAKGAGDIQKRGRFLYNNYSLVLTIIGDAQGKLAEEQKEHFSMLIRDVKPR